MQWRNLYLQIKGQAAGEAAVAMQLGHGSAHTAKGGAVCVQDLVLPVYAALGLDGILDLSILQDLVIQHRPIAVHLQTYQAAL